MKRQKHDTKRNETNDTKCPTACMIVMSKWAVLMKVYNWREGDNSVEIIDRIFILCLCFNLFMR